MTREVYRVVHVTTLKRVFLIDAESARDAARRLETGSKHYGIIIGCEGRRTTQKHVAVLGQIPSVRDREDAA